LITAVTERNSEFTKELEGMKKDEDRPAKDNS